ncbi:hypothetical protein EV561_101784 [Rhizobium sp. BK376]|nr:hypothetical protein EV561_101784 [Rhizobium sp. BK376]
MQKSLINFLAILSVLVPSAATAGGVPSNDANFHSKIDPPNDSVVLALPLDPSSKPPGIPLTDQKVTAHQRICTYGKRYSVIVAADQICFAAVELKRLNKRVRAPEN